MLPAPDALTTEYLRAPHKAVITSENPRFAWIFPQKGIEQHGFRVLVASSVLLLHEGKADACDSGKVNSKRSVNITYNGKPLRKNTEYWWQVKLWSATGQESQYSIPQKFLTAEQINEPNSYLTTSN